MSKKRTPQAAALELLAAGQEKLNAELREIRDSLAPKSNVGQAPLPPPLPPWTRHRALQLLDELDAFAEHIGQRTLGVTDDERAQLRDASNLVRDILGRKTIGNERWQYI